MSVSKTEGKSVHYTPCRRDRISRVIRKNIQIDHKTAERWLQILENLYVCFWVSPYGAPKVRAVNFAERTPIPRFYQTHLGERHYSSGKVTVVPFIRLCEELGLP